MSFGALLTAGFLLGTSVPIESTQAQPPTTKFSAVYKVRFAGLKLGKFHVQSKLSDGRYSVQGSGKLKFLSGIIFEVSGGATSSGQLSKDRAIPAAFAFNFETKKNKGGRLVMKFDQGAVTQVASQPKIRPRPDSVPVKDKHVQGVLDPLTALFFTSAPDGKSGLDGSVCDRRVPVYDGLYRFDLQLSHKKTVRVVRKRKGGYAGPAVICRIKYVPIAGHRPRGSNTIFMSQNDDIEVWLIPLPEGGMFAPYHVSVPTPYGVAQATSVAFTIDTPARKNIALVR